MRQRDQSPEALAARLSLPTLASLGRLSVSLRAEAERVLVLIAEAEQTASLRETAHG